jgi:large subunit ribosomal protein L4
MTSLSMTSATGKKAGSVELPDDIFGIEPNVPVMHQVVTAQLAAARSGTHSTKTRSEVSGGGAKPWRQKGTGRARQGSIRSPQWRGGGIAHGPKPRDYSQRTPKKMIRLALRSALSDRARDGKVVVVEEWGIDEPKTKRALEVLGALGLRTKGEREDRVLVVLFRTEDAVWKSLRNLGRRVQIVLPEELNTYDVLVNDRIVFSKATLEATVARLGTADDISTDDVTPAKATKAEQATAAADDAADDAETAGAGDGEGSDE